MAGVLLCRWVAFAQRIVICAVVCDAFDSAMPMNVAWSARESARWRLFGALRIILYVAMRKNPEPPKRLVNRPVGRPCGVAGPGVASLGPAREKILAKPNEHESNSPRKARRPARGERLRFLEPERRRTGRPGAGREWEPARNVPQPPPFRRRASLSDGSSRSGRIPRGVVHKSTARSSTCASVSQPKRESPQELRLISPGIACY